jgi:pyochelin biosynthetic protein PchC
LLFGHSMGAVIALEAARRLDALGAPCAALIVSGTRNGPLPVRQRAREPEVSDTELVRHLVAMGGMPVELCDDPEFLSMVLPYIRADGQMFRDYASATEPVISAPVVSIVGYDDVHADIRPWAKLTAAAHREHWVDGGHFYLDHAPPVEIISQVGLSTVRIGSRLER